MRSHHHYSFLNSTSNVTITPFLFLLLLLPFSLVSSFNNPLITDFSQSNLLSEKKTRLGSTPPSCHNKCNGCHPCMAVQVPTIPSHDRVKPGNLAKKLDFFVNYPSGNRFSNYKPLGWKCNCAGHFYNP